MHMRTTTESPKDRILRKKKIVSKIPQIITKHKEREILEMQRLSKYLVKF